MKAFMQRHAPHAIRVLSGFDRLLFRGKLLSLSYVKGMLIYLCQARILLKEFGGIAEQMTQQLKQAQRADRPILYLPSPKISKEQLAREITERDGI